MRDALTMAEEVALHLMSLDESAFRGRRVAVTGSSGFVGHYLVDELLRIGAKVHTVSRQTRSKAADYNHCTHRLDLCRLEAVQAFVESVQPEFVFHLASEASVKTSWQNDWGTIEANVAMAFNLLKGLDLSKRQSRVLIVSSGEVYGPVGERLVRETDGLSPRNPYAVSKAMVEMAAHRFRSERLEWVIARAFNHTGPGRKESYFESDVARQIATAAMRGERKCQLSVGNVNIIRDFSDVRDVVQKYLFLAAHAEPYSNRHVCSGVGVRLQDIIFTLAEVAGIDCEVCIDPDRLRPNDNPFLVGENRLLELRPCYSLKQTLADLYATIRSGLDDTDGRG